MLDFIPVGAISLVLVPTFTAPGCQKQYNTTEPSNKIRPVTNYNPSQVFHFLKSYILSYILSDINQSTVSNRRHLLLFR